MPSPFGVLEIHSGGQVGKVDLFVQTFFGLVFVDGEEIGSKD